MSVPPLTTMKALHLTSPPSTLTFSTSTPTPQPSETQCLIRVSASAITTSELTWSETIARSNPIPGHDVCGTIVSIPTTPSSDSRTFNVGDKVYGLTSFSRDGTVAEYVVAEPAELALVPKGLSDLEAASIPLSALTAWQALLVHAGMKAGDRVLILRGAGGVGVLAVQIARAKGGVVTATVGWRDSGLVRELGASAVLNYTKDLGLAEDVFDVVLDCVGFNARKNVWSSIKRGGVMVSVASPMEEREGREGVRGCFFVVEPDGVMLEGIGELVERGEVRAVVGSVFELEEGGNAFKALAGGHARGKIVVQVEGS